MRRLRRILLIIVVIILLLAGGLTGYIGVTLRKMLPQTGGTLNVPGLNGPVTIYRDASGIPQIYASTTHDLFMAQGIVQAQDRWWQMEFNRHTGLGRISELVGNNATALSSDIFIRTAGWNRSAQADVAASSPGTVAVMQAYADGVNAYIAGKSGPDLAVEYSVLALKGVSIPIEKWEPVDSLAWGKVMGYSLGDDLDSELERTKLYQKLGADGHNIVDNYYNATYPYDSRQTILKDGEVLPIKPDAPQPAQTNAGPLVPPGTDLSHVQTALVGGLPADFGPYLQRGGAFASNNWVIGPKLTQSGKPILANDPHLGIQMPSIWYENGLHCKPVSTACPYDVEGFSFPGVPGVIIGHNARIAWGVTNVNQLDTEDLYIIKVDPKDDTKYEVDGQSQDMKIVTETIKFGDGTPSKDVRVRITRYGPIITDSSAYANQSDKPLALRWTLDEPTDLFGAVLGVDRATDWQTFRQALTGWRWPSQNFVYADVDGNIGYQMPGLAPIRPAGFSGQVPVDGSTSQNDWKGYVPFEYLPHVYNPARGWIESSNDPVITPAYFAALSDALGSQFGKDSVYDFGKTYDYGYRGQRISQLIQANDKHTVDTVKAIQGDNASGSAAELLPTVLKLDFGSDVPKTVIDWMGQWDYQENMDSGQAALFEAFWTQLTTKVWGSHFGYVPDGSNVAWGTKLLLDQPDNPFWDDPTTTDKKETRDDMLRSAFVAAYSDVTKSLGADYKTWKWSTLHTATFSSKPLGASGISVIENLVNYGPVGVGGGSLTINHSGWSTSDPYATQSISSMRMIVDLSNFDNSQWIISTGESGHPSSDHYHDMTDKWRTIQYDTMRFSEDAIKQAATATLTLQPG
ncbi:MAG TPA: penicillin acylase family protein [Aggregatilineales bacterium]|nr:penicillin acylase family protein [Aggregatilineales bacterium]